MISNQCNLRCSYCFNNWESSLLDWPVLKPAPIEDIIKFINKTRCENVLIDFSGAEPLTNFEFIKDFISHKLEKVEYSIVTNGTLLDSDRIDFMLEHFKTLIFSLDGTERANQARKYTNGSASWSDALSNLIEAFAKNSYKVSVLMTLHSGNINNFDRSYRFIALELGIPANISIDYKSLTSKYHETLYRKFHKVFIDERLPLPAFFEEKVLSDRHKYKSKNFCRSLSQSVTVNLDGTLSFCHLLAPNIKERNKGANRIYGDIYKGIDFGNKFYKQLEKRIAIEMPECKSCPAASWCKGGCIAAHNILTQSFDKLDKNQCEIHKIIEKIAQEIREQ